MPTDYGHMAQHEDAITGLDNLNARCADLLDGQFTSPDTILPDDDCNILGLSRYAYVEGRAARVVAPYCTERPHALLERRWRSAE